MRQHQMQSGDNGQGLACLRCGGWWFHPSDVDTDCPKAQPTTTIRPAEPAVERRPVGIRTWFDPASNTPTSEYMWSDEPAAPKLTHELIDRICAAVDVRQIERTIIDTMAQGGLVDIAAHTLNAIREQLHDQVHDHGAPDDSG